jgi:hypothetical protein
MSEPMTREEFKKALWAYRQDQRVIASEDSLEMRARVGKDAKDIRDSLISAYDALTARSRSWGQC